MTLHWYDEVNAVVSIAGSAGLSGYLHRSGKRKAWPWLFAFALMVFVSTLVCFGMEARLSTFHRMADHRALYAAWFWTFWASKAVRALLGFAVLYESVHALPLSGHTPRTLRITFGTAALVFTAGCVYFASLTSPNTALLLSALALSLQRAIAVSWCAFALALIISSQRCALTWTPIPLRVMTGFLVTSVASLVCAHFEAESPLRAQTLSVTNDFIDAAVVVFWTFALRRSEKTSAVQDPVSLNDLLSPIGLSIPTSSPEAHS